VAQLDDVYSDLRLNYETLKGLISLVSLSVAKPTHFETTPNTWQHMRDTWLAAACFQRLRDMIFRN